VIANECAFYSGFAFFDSFLSSKLIPHDISNNANVDFRVDLFSCVLVKFAEIAKMNISIKFSTFNTLKRKALMNNKQQISPTSLKLKVKKLSF